MPAWCQVILSPRAYHRGVSGQQPQQQRTVPAGIPAGKIFGVPLVVSPASVLAVEVQSDTPPGVLWADGRRTWSLPAGSRVEVRRGQIPVRLARLHTAPFTDRLVRKFELPVRGWRGASGRGPGA